MSNSQNNKNEQQNNLCTTLTEQWEKGELPSGMYYIEFKDGDIVKDVYAFGSWGNINEHFLKQVLAPVPSYDRFCRLNHLENDFIKAHERINEMKKENTQLHKFLEEFNALDVAKENQQLKELLYKCREKLDELDYGCEVWQGELTGFIEEIDNAIGEKNDGN